ncbi:UNVERIFIED_CONTAM: hypothetical protein Sradi_3318700 [Sesamum radiatum]|uniref:Uncharacterized protein n=1 Tax=Sesamum radiatum TaxID=300843 RepID=A0AAW2R1P1_SESRA
MSKSEAKSLANFLESFEFQLGIVIWYDILFCINMVSKKLQSKPKSIDSTIEQIEAALAFFEGYRKTKFAASMNIAKDIAFDMAIASLRNRFEELKRFKSIFGFLLDLKRLKLLDESEL